MSAGTVYFNLELPNKTRVKISSEAAKQAPKLLEAVAKFNLRPAVGCQIPSVQVPYENEEMLKRAVAWCELHKGEPVRQLPPIAGKVPHVELTERDDRIMANLSILELQELTNAGQFLGSFNLIATASRYIKQKLIQK